MNGDTQQKAEAILADIRAEAAGGNYIYRGENERYDSICSTLLRDYRKEKTDTDIVDIYSLDAVGEKIDNTKSLNINAIQSEIAKEASQFTNLTDPTEILTEIQHYGGKTNLLDFTTDYLIALFFACDGKRWKNGRVILVNRDRIDKYDGQTQVEIIKPKTHQNSRVAVQKSVFVQSESGYLVEHPPKIKIIPINYNLKQVLLTYLNQYHDIGTRTIYSDLFGYIQHQGVHEDANTHFYRGRLYETKKPREAIGEYDKSIELNQNHVAAHHNRACAKVRILSAPDEAKLTEKEKTDWPKEALEDFDKAEQLTPDEEVVELQLVYMQRGDAKLQFRLYNEAIIDFDKALILESKIRDGVRDRTIANLNKILAPGQDEALTYHQRGIANRALDRHNKALSDFEKAVTLLPRNPSWRFDLGCCKIKLNDINGGCNDLRAALNLAQEKSQDKLASKIQDAIKKHCSE